MGNCDYYWYLLEHKILTIQVISGLFFSFATSGGGGGNEA